MTTQYIPTRLNRWARPSNYSGADWSNYFVAPVLINRDSGTIDRANYGTQWTALSEMQSDVDLEDTYSPQRVRENHWATGWVEWVAIHEDNAEALREADDLAEALESHTVLDNEALLQLECDEYLEGWESYACRDFVRGLASKLGLSEDTVDSLMESSSTLDYFERLLPSGERFLREGSGLCIRTRDAVRNATAENFRSCFGNI